MQDLSRSRSHPQSPPPVCPRIQDTIYLTPAMGQSNTDKLTPPSLPLMPVQLEDERELSSSRTKIRMRTDKNPFARDSFSNNPSPNQAFYPEYGQPLPDRGEKRPLRLAPFLPALSLVSDEVDTPLRPRFRTNLKP